MAYKPVSAGDLPAGFGDYSLKGKTAIVTGGASGIGWAISQLFSKKGAAVMILDINGKEAHAAAERLNKTAAAGATAVGIECNVAQRASVEKAFAEVLSTRPRIDILVNNAGVAAVGNVELCTEADMQRCYDINVKGVFTCSQLGVKNMLKDNKGGVILNLASIASKIGLADRFAYSMSKGAVLTMTYSIATDYVKKGIRCNCMIPARIHTPFVDGYLKQHYPGAEAEMYAKLAAYQPIGRMGLPHDVAAMALYLCSDEASFLTGSAYNVDGGVVCKM